MQRVPIRDFDNDSEMQNRFFEDPNPEIEYKAHGGHINPSYDFGDHARQYSYEDGGYVHGYSGGQDDDVDTHIPEGSYVMDATTVSSFGDGNSNHGAKRFEQFEDFIERRNGHQARHSIKAVRKIGKGRPVKAKISDGEYVVKPDIVTKLGKGNNIKGSKMLDEFRNNLRRQKGISKFLPPKSKDFRNYLRG
jgi:hypothetical protein